MSWVTRSLIRYGYFPLMFLGVGGAGVALIISGPEGLPASIRAAGILGLMALALLLSFGAERLLPYEPDWNSSRGDFGRDVAHFLVNESMSLGPLLVIPIFATVATPPAASASPVSQLWPGEWALPVQVLFTLAVFDLGQNLFHWASHRWEPLWRLHAVHHSVERMYGLNGIMKHPIYQIASSVVSLTPLVVLGMPEVFSLVIVYCSFVQLLLQHSNVDYCTGPVRRIFSTAEVHRFHHLRGTAGDVNFALFFAFWDHLLGNAYDAETRLESRDIGVDYEGYPQSWAGQMLAPLRSFKLPTG